MVCRCVERDVASLGDEKCVVCRFWVIRKQRPHLCGRFQIVLIVIELEPGFVKQRRARLDTQQSRVGCVVVVVDVVKVVCEHQWNVKFLGESEQILDRAAFNLDAVVHDLYEVVLFPKNVPHRRGSLLGFLVLSKADSGLHFATGATACCNKALSLLSKNLEVHPRMRVETFDVGR